MHKNKTIFYISTSPKEIFLLPEHIKLSHRGQLQQLQHDWAVKWPKRPFMSTSWAHKFIGNCMWHSGSDFGKNNWLDAAFLWQYIFFVLLILDKSDKSMRKWFVLSNQQDGPTLWIKTQHLSILMAPRFTTSHLSEGTAPHRTAPHQTNLRPLSFVFFLIFSFFS